MGEGGGCEITLIIIVFAILLIAGSYCNGYDNGYKNGQIDAINQVVKFKLVEKEDKTKVWEKVEINK